MSDPADPAARLVLRLLDHTSRLDMAGAVALLADDVVLELPYRPGGYPKRLEGDDVRAFYEDLPKYLRRVDFFDVELRASTPDGLVVVEYRSDGETLSGRPYRNTYAGVFQVRDGKVALVREYYDPLVLIESMRTG